jgi:RHS repeat-associated protein
VGRRRRSSWRSIVATLLIILVFESSAVPGSVAAVDTPTPNAVEDPAPPPKIEPVEIVEARTETSQTFDNHDGTLSTSFFSDPAFYQPSGKVGFDPIELTFAPAVGLDGLVESTKAPVAVEVAPADDPRGVVALTYGDVRIALVPFLEEAAIAETRPTISDSMSEVLDAFPGIDLRVFAQPYGAATFLVLHEVPTAARWTFVVDAPGLSLRLAKDGSVEFVDAKDSVVGAMHAPYAIDSTPDEFVGGGRTTSALSYTLGTAGSLPTVTVSVDDASWLKDAVYPVYVDPSVTIYPPTSGSTYGDSFINQGNAGMNYGNYSRPDTGQFELWLGQSPSPTTDVARDLVKFDLSTIAGTTIDSATFQVYPYHQYYDAPTTETAYLRRVTADWVENTVTWTNFTNVQKYTTTGTVTAGCVEGSSCSFGVTSLVQGWLSGTYPNYGVQVDKIGLDYHDWARVYSSEQSANPTARPRLIVTYHVPTASAAYPSGGPTSSRTLSWVYADSAGHAQSDFHVDLSTSSTFASILATSGDVASADAGWAIPTATSLTSGTTYYWRAKVRDGTSWSAWSTTASFTHDPAASLGLQAHNTFEDWDLGAGDSLSVNVATGNLILTHPLVSLPIRGGSLPVTLTYNSFETSNPGLGPGWRLNLMRRLIINADGTVTFYDADGSRHKFTAPVTVGTVTTYTRPATLYATLVKDTSITANEFTLTYKDQSKDRFDISGTNGILVKAEDRFGTAVTVAYSTGTNISTVTDPAGRQLTFTWDTAPTPDRLTQIQDWAWVSSGEIQTTPTGARRAYRFFYDASGQLAGWSDPLNTAGSCPTGGSHLTCLTYSAGLLSSVGKTQSIASATCGFGGCIQPVTTLITYIGTEPRTIYDAEQVATSAPGTVFSRPAAGQMQVVRQGTPASTTTYGQASSTDPYARIQSAWRAYAGSSVERRTTWDASQIVERASVTDNYGALFSTPARTTTTTYAAGSMGNVSRTTEPLTASPATNRWTDFTYNANNDVTQQIVSQDGSATLRTTTRYCYDPGCSTSATGLSLLRRIDNYVDGTAGGSGGNATDVTTEYQVDSYGRVTRETRKNYDAGGVLLDQRAIGYTFDTNGDHTSVISNYADGLVTGGDDFTPNAATAARTDLTTTFTHDTAGNLVSVADPRRAIESPAGADDYVSRIAYDAVNEQIRETTPTTPGLTITCPVDNPTCRAATWAYDELGQIMVATDYGKVDSAYHYDHVGRTVETLEFTHGLISAETTGLSGFDAAGRVLWTKDRNQVNDLSLGRNETTFDSLGRAVDTTNGAVSTPDVATTTRTTRDAQNRVVSIETGVGTGTGQTTVTAYDLGGRAIQTNDEFACSTSTFDYRDLEQATTEGKTPGASCTGTGSRTLTNTYDGLGRLTRTEITASTTAGEVGTRTTDVVLDAAGNIRSSAVGGGTSFTVNLLDQVAVELRPGGATSKTTYDAAGNPVDRCFWSTTTTEVCQAADFGGYGDTPDSASTTTFDARNKPVTLKVPQAGITTYDPNHDYAPSASYLTVGPDVDAQTVFGYDDRHRLTTITHQRCSVAPGTHTCSGTITSLGSDLYAYDENNNRIQVNESNGASSSDSYFCYDARDELTHVRSATGCTSGLLETFAYDDAGNRTTKIVGGATTTFTYDTEGQLTSCSPSCGTVAYDAAGRTSQWNGWFLSYDGEGRLTSACKASGCPTTADQVSMTYDGEGHRTSLTVRAANQVALTTQFRYQGDSIVEESVAGAVTRRYVVDEAGAVVKVVIPTGQAQAGEYLVIWNGHGDATALWRIDASGLLTLANSFTYDPWGTPTVAIHNGVPDLGYRFLYVGRSDVQWDNTFGLGLHYMHARHYSPTLGRFVQPDPAEAEANLYVYTSNNPATRTDASGEVWCLAGALAGGVGVLVTCGLQVGAIVVAGVGLVYFSAKTGVMVGELVRDNWRKAKPVGVALSANELLTLSKKGGQNVKVRIKALERAKEGLEDKIEGAPRAPSRNHWERQIENIQRTIDRLRGRTGRS